MNKKTKESKEKKIQPRGKFILVRQDEEESRVSQSGLIVPSNVEQEQKSHRNCLISWPTN